MSKKSEAVIYIVRYGVGLSPDGKYCAGMEDREFTDVMEAWKFFAGHSQAMSLFTKR